MHAPTMPCSRCAGTGHVPLPAKLMKALALLKDRELSSPEFRRLTCGLSRSPSAANQLLERLRTLDLVNRRRIGRVWFYSLKFFSR